MTTPDPFAAHEAANYDANTFSAPTPSQPQPAAGQYPAQQPGAPIGGPGQPATGGTDGVSLGALIAGLLGGGFIAIILGATGLRRTATGARSGTGMAWTGIVLGTLGTIAWTALITWAITMAAVAPDGAFTGSGFEELDGMFDTEATYGSDPFLDALWDDCDAGDMAACDQLFVESPLGSGYEDFGYECGTQGRPLFQLECASD